MLTCSAWKHAHFIKQFCEGHTVCARCNFWSAAERLKTVWWSENRVEVVTVRLCGGKGVSMWVLEEFFSY